ncbi:MAG: radical SAM protein [Candidatus Nealsonbacteria bacterium]|nr:radical SAM protein [Candidatus Nealsonbacteria bacterium]
MLTVDQTLAGPRVLLLAVTMRCDARCRMCSIWQTPQADMSCDLLRLALADGVLAGNLEYLGLTGGEPLLHPALGELVEILIDKCLRLKEISLTTNGLSSAQVQATVRGLLDMSEDNGPEIVVNVSLDGVDDVHNRVRGRPDAFFNATATLNALTQLRRTEPRLAVRLNTVVSSMNAESLYPLLRYAQEIEVPLNFSLVMDTDTYTNSHGAYSEVALRPKQRDKLRRFFARLHLPAMYDRVGQLSRDYADHLRGMLAEETRRLPCPFRDGDGYLILPDGDVYVCGVAQKGWCGNLTRTPFSVLWGDAATRNQRKELLRPACARCPSNCHLHACYDHGNPH